MKALEWESLPPFPPDKNDNTKTMKVTVDEIPPTFKVGDVLHQRNGFGCTILSKDEPPDPSMNPTMIVECVDSYPHPIYSRLEKGRESWDEYFMGIAKQVASRSTCDRRNVGAVLVKNKTIISTGYNGSVRGTPHCDSEAGHILIYDEGQKRNRCIRPVHAEANAVCQAAKNGASTEGSTLYMSASPCYGCFNLVANAGIQRIIYSEEYPDPRFIAAADAAKVELSRL